MMMMMVMSMYVCSRSVNVSQEPGRITGARTGVARQGDDDSVRCEREVYSAVSTAAGRLKLVLHLHCKYVRHTFTPT